MLINDVSKITTLTKKAIEYYVEQKLVQPVILENGYRDFSQNDVERLIKISAFRRLGFSIQDIKAIFDDDTNNTLQKLSVQKELSLQKEQAKKAILNKLCSGKSYSEINMELEDIERSSSVTERLLEAFPGYYGRFVCLHFARFLNEPLLTDMQRQAYERIILFLDNVPSLVFSEEIRAFLDESSNLYDADTINRALASMKVSVESPESFISENKEALERYLAYKQSDEYRCSPLSKMQTILKEFNSSIGYYDVFIPAMKQLSQSYAEYYIQMETANKKLLQQYPQIEQIGNEL